MSTPKPATEATIRANRAVRDKLPFDDTTDFENADRGLVVRATGQVLTDEGDVAWDFDRWSFLEGESPDTVNPSLWRQSQLVSKAGIYKVADGIYQARGFDLSVASYIRGEKGWIVVDPSISVEPTKAAYDLIREHVEDLPVTAVIHTHSHIDHYGGVRAFVTDEDVEAGNVRIIAPVDFLEESVSENVMLGNAMARRKSYMYGEIVGYGPDRSVGAGLGQVTSAGEVTLIPPTDIISETGTELTVDGVRIVFQHTPGAEAPAEMCFYLPDLKALCGAEIVTHTQHNLYTLRGAKIRDSLIWSKHLHEMLQLFGDAEVLFSSHHWPTWGNGELRDLIESQRDMYRYLHDETVRLANNGYTPVEIGEQIELPDALAQRFANRGYYGSINHNVKSTYVYYLGWFDANPATLNPLEHVDAGPRYVEYMGGADAIIEKARADFEKGEYRWVAEVLNHLIFAQPENTEARELQADTFEQLGYQAENGTWRNFYLTGAMELRDGIRKQHVLVTASADSVRAMSVSMFLDYIAMRIKAPEAVSLSSTFAVVLPDIDEKYVLELGNGVLNHRPGTSDDVQATLTFDRSVLDAVVLGTTDIPDAVENGDVQVDGDITAVREFVALLDVFDFWFDIVTP
ncbi:Alkyl sulfatase BDS1, metallo-beta-lactamase superfamily [Paraoerskovia marina]|uniref:Linear primary-alkylsulfatase n=1 Tax=Paraoerskovia marina TaxID=545619 RepID=A0A1H1NAH0_9CELL|nr:alkyl sulfatase dimerization domain-containing protein [Paraoerskovia marina]SDR95898.1 Alkyl sulfatase BDS1, metallo-beta-lactamase superfamily [Paraoerskovia marina]